MTISPYIKIDNYILNNLLPKCNIVFGNIFSSIYLQLYLNTNHNNNIENFKKGKCWMSISTISENCNCNIRTSMNILKNMENIGLIEKSYKGKFYMFSIKHFNTYDTNSLLSLNNNFEKELLNINNEKKKNLDKKFNEINNNYNNYNNYVIEDIKYLKKIILEFEQIKSGSSLMCLNYFYYNIINNKYVINNITETEISKRLGISQPTINRILKKFDENNYIKINYDNRKKLNNIIINEERFKMNNEKNEIPCDEFICPICNKKVVSLKKLQSHIRRCKDEMHVIFESLIEKNNTSNYDEIINIYNENKIIFDNINKKKDEEKTKYNSAAIELVKYYYGLTNTKCPSWGKEINQIKSQLKNGMTSDEIMEVMRYMARKSYPDLRYFSTNINDAFLIKKCKEEVNIPGSDAYLIRKYFIRTSQKLNDRLMIQAVNKINELRNNGHDNKDIKIIIDYMIEKQCPNFNFIINIANEAMKDYENRKDKAKAYTIEELVNKILNNDIDYGVIMIKDNNYSVAKKDIIMRLKNDLMEGKVDLTRVNKSYYKLAIMLAREIYNRKLISNNIAVNQWMINTKLNLVND